MSAHQHDQNANELWAYFRAVVQWVEDTFTTYRKEMKSVEWGPLYDTYHDRQVDTADLERQTAALIQDPDVTKNRGIYAYLLTRDPRHLSIRQFNDQERLASFERQGRRCANGTYCKTPGNDDGQMQFSLEQMEADHITPWSKGGKTTTDNCQMLCISCNRDKRGN